MLATDRTERIMTPGGEREVNFDRDDRPSVAKVDGGGGVERK